jgi:nitrogen fixation protein
MKELAPGAVHTFIHQFTSGGTLVEPQLAARLPPTEDEIQGSMIAAPILEVTVGLTTYKDKEWVGKPFLANEPVAVVTKNENAGKILLAGGWYVDLVAAPTAPAMMPEAPAMMPEAPATTSEVASATPAFGGTSPAVSAAPAFGGTSPAQPVVKRNLNEVPVVLSRIQAEKLLLLVKKSFGIIHPNENPALERPLNDALKKSEQEFMVYFTREQTKVLLKVVKSSWSYLEEVSNDEVATLEVIFKAATVYGIART